MSKTKLNLTLGILTLLVFAVISVVKADIFDDIALAIKSGNCKDVAKYFGTRVELKIDDVENIYSKAQAEMILKNFFNENPPVNFSIKHRGASEKGLPYIIGYLQTTTGKYRTYFLFKEIEGKLYIQELQFEKEN